ncbi:hypothetical protein OE88DRAFT_1735756 [Heliocybe sulcata]|uniref:Uncharacterized protein n=1 Tax=Heliocybe sulcata TaxID=5364 RepID=A0A5C3N165_9AGAM|nr:hypothetical protein OE88DRAFT_1735756 [Heliocybe sulcata]
MPKETRKERRAGRASGSDPYRFVEGATGLRERSFVTAMRRRDQIERNQMKDRHLVFMPNAISGKMEVSYSDERKSRPPPSGGMQQTKLSCGGDTVEKPTKRKVRFADEGVPETKDGEDVQQTEWHEQKSLASSEKQLFTVLNGYDALKAEDRGTALRQLHMHLEAMGINDGQRGVAGW